MVIRFITIMVLLSVMAWNCKELIKWHELPRDRKGKRIKKDFAASYIFTMLMCAYIVGKVGR